VSLFSSLIIGIFFLCINCSYQQSLFRAAVYNAPNAGSILLEGQWFALGLNFSSEYDVIRQEEADKLADEEWKKRMLHQRMGSSFIGEIPPSVA
jgi:hypothetical protein